MRILYLTQWFDPEPGVIKGPAFVRALAAAGHDVTVVTGLPNYPTGRLYPGYRLRLFQEEVIEGVTVKRLPLYPSHDSSSLGRALNFASFFLSAFLYGLFRAGRYDLVYVYHPPITVGLAAALFGAIRRRPFILEIQDLWPDSVGASGMAGTRGMTGILGGLCTFVYRRARRIVAQAEGMRALLIERGVPPAKVSTIRNWADHNAIDPSVPVARAALGFRDRFTFLYAGNLGRAQALETVVRAAKLAANRGAAIDLVLIGDGIDAQSLRRLVAKLDADNVRFLPRVPKEEVTGIMAAADALVIHLADQPLFNFTIPSKTQFYLAMGRPILAGLGGEAGELLKESGAAIVVPPEDAEALADAMIRFSRLAEPERTRMGANGRAYYGERLSFEKGVAATLDVIHSAEAEIDRLRPARSQESPK